MNVLSAEAVLFGVTEIAQRHLGWEGPLALDMRLVEDLALDSVRLLTLAAEVENRFRVLLDERDEAALETVANLVELVRRKLEA